LPQTLGAALEAHHRAERHDDSRRSGKSRAPTRQIYGFTDHDEDLVVSGLTYHAATGYQRSAIRASSGFENDNLELIGALASSAITAADVRACLWDYAVVEVFFCNWADLTQGVGKMHKGKLGPIKTGRNSFTAQLMGLASHLDQAVGRLYGASCDADLGDARCGISLAPFTKSGAVTSITSRRVFADSSRAEADGYFNGGKLTWLTGNNAGLKMEVKTFLNAGGAIALQLPMPYAVQVGDTYSATHGCDKSAATCTGTFANIVNYRGFQFVAGPRRMISGGLP
jgi:uncharacterized phage protein (TIGR02218 family)